MPNQIVIAKIHIMKLFIQDFLETFLAYLEHLTARLPRNTSLKCVDEKLVDGLPQHQTVLPI